MEKYHKHRCGLGSRPIKLRSIEYPEFHNENICLPTPRSGRASLYAAKRPTQRSIHELATSFAMTKRTYKEITIHPKDLISFMGFPSSWFKAMLDAGVVYTNK